jgi:hypothetical protein
MFILISCFALFLPHLSQILSKGSFSPCEGNQIIAKYLYLALKLIMRTLKHSRLRHAEGLFLASETYFETTGVRNICSLQASISRNFASTLSCVVHRH